MIKSVIERWDTSKDKVRAVFAAKHPENYLAVVRAVVEALHKEEYDSLDPKRIHEIDDGDYQGTLIYIIGEAGYQPSDYWFVKVSYGSCSGCDTLEDIRNYDDALPTEKQIGEYMTLALHIVQGIKPLGGLDE